VRTDTAGLQARFDTVVENARQAEGLGEQSRQADGQA